MLVVNSDLGAAVGSKPGDKFGVASLSIYDMATGKPLHFVDLSGIRPGEKRFPNDVAVDANGNAYVIDSLAAAIYKVTPTGQAGVLLASEQFRGPVFNLNGIVVHPDGYLIVAKKVTGCCSKFLSANQRRLLLSVCRAHSSPLTASCLPRTMSSP